jgi:hypothetical protein
VFHGVTAIEYRAGSTATILSPNGADEKAAEESSERRLAAEQRLDRVLADSFPASDPPSWNPGMIRPAPVVSPVEDSVVYPETSRTGASHRKNGADRVVFVSEPITGKRSFLRGLVSFAGAIATVALVPLGILLIGLPVAGAIRGLLELIGWLSGVSLL